jgi:hypothetical protein
MKFPVFSLLAGNFRSRDGFARDYPLQRRVKRTPESEQRLAVRKDRIRPLVGELEGWMRTERARLSGGKENRNVGSYSARGLLSLG